MTSNQDRDYLRSVLEQVHRDIHDALDATTAATPSSTADEGRCGRDTSDDQGQTYVCESPRGHYGAHNQARPYCSWTDASCVFPDSDDPWWETQDETFVPQREPDEGLCAAVFDGDVCGEIEDAYTHRCVFRPPLHDEDTLGCHPFRPQREPIEEQEARLHDPSIPPPPMPSGGTWRWEQEAPAEDGREWWTCAQCGFYAAINCVVCRWWMHSPAPLDIPCDRHHEYQTAQPEVREPLAPRCEARFDGERCGALIGDDAHRECEFGNDPSPMCHPYQSVPTSEEGTTADFVQVGDVEPQPTVTTTHGLGEMYVTADYPPTAFRKAIERLVSERAEPEREPTQGDGCAHVFADGRRCGRVEEFQARSGEVAHHALRSEHCEELGCHEWVPPAPEPVEEWWTREREDDGMARWRPPTKDIPHFPGIRFSVPVEVERAIRAPLEAENARLRRERDYCQSLIEQFHADAHEALEALRAPDEVQG